MSAILHATQNAAELLLRRLSARTRPLGFATDRTEDQIKAMEPPGSLAEAAQIAMAEAGQALGERSITFSVRHVPRIPAIPEACNIIEHSLALLLELAEVDRGSVVITSRPADGDDALLLLRFTPAADCGRNNAPRLPWNKDPFAMVCEAGGRITCQFRYPVTTLILQLPRPDLRTIN
jgi:hypothetical protein